MLLKLHLSSRIRPRRPIARYERKRKRLPQTLSLDIYMRLQRLREIPDAEPLIRYGRLKRTIQGVPEKRKPKFSGTLLNN